MLLITSCEKDQLSAPGVVPGEAEIEQGIFDPLLNVATLAFLEGLKNNCLLAFSSKRNIFDAII